MALSLFVPDDNVSRTANGTATIETDRLGVSQQNIVINADSISGELFDIYDITYSTPKSYLEYANTHYQLSIAFSDNISSDYATLISENPGYTITIGWDYTGTNPNGMPSNPRTTLTWTKNNKDIYIPTRVNPYITNNNPLMYNIPVQPDPQNQTFVIIQSDGNGHTLEQRYSLAGLTLVPKDS